MVTGTEGSHEVDAQHDEQPRRRWVPDDLWKLIAVAAGSAIIGFLASAMLEPSPAAKLGEIEKRLGSIERTLEAPRYSSVDGIQDIRFTREAFAALEFVLELLIEMREDEAHGIRAILARVRATNEEAQGHADELRDRAKRHGSGLPTAPPPTP